MHPIYRKLPASGKKGLEPLFLILEITILPLKLFPFPWVGNYIIPPFEGDQFYLFASINVFIIIPNRGKYGKITFIITINKIR